MKYTKNNWEFLYRAKLDERVFFLIFLRTAKRNP